MEIVGEATITKAELVSASDVPSVYGTNLFLTQPEFERYVEKRKRKAMLVLVVGDARRYTVPLKLSKSVTMAGRYMTRRMYQQLREESARHVSDGSSATRI